jgi:glycosyltransferase involved in cell wall biosynthesis
MLQADKNPVVTVVIPTLRRSDLVLRAIHSALRQTYERLEVVVVVDGPDEATRAALRAVQDARLRVVAVDESVGGSDARNLGVKHARGEWVAFLDDDDEWLPEKIEKQLALAAQASEPYPIISTQAIVRSPEVDLIWPLRYPREGEPICDYLLTRTMPFAGEGLAQTSTLMARRELLERVPFTSGLPKHQDLDWNLRADQYAGTKYYFVREPLTIWYVGEKRTAITNRINWRRSFDWISGHRDLMTPRAYAAFLSTTVCAEAAKQRQWRAIPKLLWEILFRGKPGIVELSIFMGLWLSWPSLRHKLRALRFAAATK